MPSPFPGMDPYIEEQHWQGFHTRFVTVLGDALVGQVRPRYIVDVEEYVYLSRESEEREKLIGPDVSIAEDDTGWPPASGGTATAVALQPVIRTLPTPKRRRQHFLTIRDRQNRNVVTVIEMLSPWNKAAGDGQNEYLSKRQNVFATHANLVEIDLLRRGVRLPTVEPLPTGDYFAFVCRRSRFPKVDVYAWTLRDKLPSIPVPLSDEDPDAVLDLQNIFSTTYDRAGYDYALKYAAEVVPPLPESDAAWAQVRLKPHP